MDPKMLKQLEQLIAKALKNVASKDDLKNFATKDDLKNFATKSDLKEMSNDLKKELYVVRDELIAKIEDVDNGVGILMQSTDDYKADKKELFVLRKRVEKLERKVFTN